MSFNVEAANLRPLGLSRARRHFDRLFDTLKSALLWVGRILRPSASKFVLSRLGCEGSVKIREQTIDLSKTSGVGGLVADPSAFAHSTKKSLQWPTLTDCAIS